jgi:hypothetical protein
MSMTERAFPDIAGLLDRKAAGRRERARLDFAQKLAVLDRLRELAQVSKQTREARRSKTK